LLKLSGYVAISTVLITPMVFINNYLYHKCCVLSIFSLQAKLLLKTAHSKDERLLKQTIQAVDMGLLMGNAFRNELSKTASLLCKVLHQNSAGKIN